MTLTISARNNNYVNDFGCLIHFQICCTSPYHLQLLMSLYEWGILEWDIKQETLIYNEKLYVSLWNLSVDVDLWSVNTILICKLLSAVTCTGHPVKCWSCSPLLNFAWSRKRESITPLEYLALERGNISFLYTGRAQGSFVQKLSVRSLRMFGTSSPTASTVTEDNHTLSQDETTSVPSAVTIL